MQLATNLTAATPVSKYSAEVGAADRDRFAQYKVIRRNGAVVAFEPGKIDRQIRPRRGKGVADALFQYMEIAGITGAVWQFDVDVARLFAEREIFRGVNREREHRRVVRKN